MSTYKDANGLLGLVEKNSGRKNGVIVGPVKTAYLRMLLKHRGDEGEELEFSDQKLFDMIVALIPQE